MKGNLIPDEAFSMTGLWYNPHNGDSFEVRDTYYDNNNIYIIAKDGRQFTYDQVEAYIQAENPEDIRMLKQRMKYDKEMANRRNQSQELPPEVSSILQNEFSDDDPGLTAAVEAAAHVENTTATTVMNAPASQPTNTVKIAPVEDEDMVMVRRMLSKASKPKIKVSLDWPKLPIKQIDMLCNYMCIEPDKLSDYLISAINVKEIADTIRKAVSNEIQKQLCILERGEIQVKAITAPKKPAANKAKK